MSSHGSQPVLLPFPPSSSQVLVITDVLQPPDRLPVERAPWTAMWHIAFVGDAPCQCFSPGSNRTTSPGRIFSIGPLPLNVTNAERHGQHLAKRMRVARRPL
jgi:hypothetical protein